MSIKINLSVVNQAKNTISLIEHINICIWIHMEQLFFIEIINYGKITKVFNSTRRKER